MIMFIRKISFQISFIFLAFFLTGCATTKKPVPSGFLDDYSNVEEMDSEGGVYISQNSEKKIGDYSKFKIEPVEIRFHPGAHEGVDDAELKQLVEFYDSHLKQIFGEKYQIVDTTGEDTAILRTAITDVKPNKIYLNLHWSTTLLGAGIGGADFEADFVDSVTGESIISVMDAKKGKRTKYFKGLTKWGHTKSVIEAWAKTLVELADKSKEK